MDYYDILGIDTNANKSDIKNAYRKQALKYHPDRNKCDVKCEIKFKEINNAYEILYNNEKRIKYDLNNSYTFSFSKPNKVYENALYDLYPQLYGQITQLLGKLSFDEILEKIDIKKIGIDIETPLKIFLKLMKSNLKNTSNSFKYNTKSPTMYIDVVLDLEYYYNNNNKECLLKVIRRCDNTLEIKKESFKLDLELKSQCIENKGSDHSDYKYTGDIIFFLKTRLTLNLEG